jgi:hypothetical protein
MWIHLRCNKRSPNRRGSDLRGVGLKNFKDKGDAL